MKGDKAKPVSSFMRWIEATWDGVFKPKKTWFDKKYMRKWRRRREKRNLDKE